MRIHPARPLILTLALALAAGCKSKAPAMPPTDVGVITLKAQSITLTTMLPGRVVPHRVADVRPQATGVILKRLFNEGGDVKAGQPLYQIDPAPYRAAYASAAATVQKDAATLASATALLERYRPLVSSHAVSRQDYDNALAAQRGAAADLAGAKAALELARVNLVYTKVLSPIAGRIGRSSVTEGALVTADQATALATVQQLNPIYVDVTQPSALLLRLKREYAEGHLRSAGKNQAQVRLTLEDGGAYAQVGALQFSEITVDPETGSVTLRAVFPNPNGLLLPGMFVQEVIQEGVNDTALLVPQRGVTHDQKGQPTALVVNKDNKVELRQLVTERAIGDQWLVTDGLNAGDRVIVDGLQKIGPGMPVHAVEVSTAAVHG